MHPVIILLVTYSTLSAGEYLLTTWPAINRSLAAPAIEGYHLDLYLWNTNDISTVDFEITFVFKENVLTLTLSGSTALQEKTSSRKRMFWQYIPFTGNYKEVHKIFVKLLGPNAYAETLDPREARAMLTSDKGDILLHFNCYGPHQYASEPIVCANVFSE